MTSFPTALPEHQNLRSLWSFTAQHLYSYSLTWILWIFLSLYGMRSDMEKGRSELDTFTQSSVTKSQALCVEGREGEGGESGLWASSPLSVPGAGTAS